MAWWSLLLRVLVLLPLCLNGLGGAWPVHAAATTAPVALAAAPHGDARAPCHSATSGAASAASATHGHHQVAAADAEVAGAEQAGCCDTGSCDGACAHHASALAGDLLHVAPGRGYGVQAQWRAQALRSRVLSNPTRPPIG